MRVLPARPDENLESARGFAAEAARRGSRLLCLPEACLTGFPWEWLAAHREVLTATLEAMRSVARASGLHLSFSHFLPDREGRLANTHLLLNPTGESLAEYRKIHLFSLFHEERHVVPGDRRVVARTPWGPTGLAVCYDVRFPELFRACALDGAVLFLCPAAFPYPRREPWRVLARARAAENQAFLLGTNAVGPEGDGEDAVTYFGTSLAAGPLGEVLAEGDETSEVLLSAELDFDLVAAARRSIRVFEDRRPEAYGPGGGRARTGP
jgi:predicted amidohydrolase